MGNLRIQGGLIWGEDKLERNNQLDIPVLNGADQEIKIAEDCLILPGLIDFHCHLWAPGASVGVTDTELISSGVTACVDAGTFGYDGWLNADRLWSNSSIEILSWLSVLPEGLTIHPNPNPTKPEEISMEKMLEAASHSRGRLLGYKVRLGQVDAATDIGLLKVARTAAEKSGLRLMVHLTDSFLSIDEVVTMLRKGDIVTHPYHGNRGNILNQDGKVSQAFMDAIENGLLLDVGQGSKHFSWEIFQKAISEGITPDTISTDLVRNTWKKSPVNDLCYVLSRFIAGGLSKEAIAKSMFHTAAGIMGIENSYNNAVVIKPDYSDIHYYDADEAKISANINYQPELIVNKNKLVYQNSQ